MSTDPTPSLDAQLLAATNLAGTFVAASRGPAGYVREAISEAEAARPWQDRLPPNALRHYYGVRDGVYRDDLYLASGRADVARLREILAADGIAVPGPRLLDFGCGAGRMLRHLGAEAEAGEVWGVDIHAEAIHWAATHLPPFHCVTTTTQPHLPFEDRSFDLIYAGSVWTHIGDLDAAWLLEMRRLLTEGGRLYLTITDRDTLARIAAEAPDHASHDHVAALDAETGMLGRDWAAFVTRTGPWAQRVVYDREAFLKMVGRWFDIRSVTPGAYGWQTGVLLSRRVR